MNKLTYLLLITSSLISTCVNASRIYGESKDHADFEIPFFTYSDLLTTKTDTVFTLLVNSDGTFDQTFEVDQARVVFAFLGVHKIWFIAEPDKEYNLVFPEYIEKTDAEIFNPYFKPILLMCGMKGLPKDDPNYLINKFDDAYWNYMGENLMDMVKNGKKSGMQAFIDSMSVEYPQCESTFFNDWKDYRFYTLRRIAHARNHSYVINNYFRNKPIAYNNPAYIYLFKDVFKNYFDHFELMKEHEMLKTAINKAKSPKAVAKVLKRVYELDDVQLRELAAIKGMYDAYYGKLYKKKAILITLDSIANFSEYPEHRIIASNMIDKLTHLNVGTMPPDFSYENAEGDIKYISEFKNEYLYVAFYHSSLTPCLEQIEILKDLSIKHKKNFKVLMIVFDSNRSKAIKNLERFNLPFEYVFPTDPEKTKKEWKIRTYPTYYLLGLKGELIFSPAPAPTEHFENYFFSIVE